MSRSRRGNKPRRPEVRTDKTSRPVTGPRDLAPAVQASPANAHERRWVPAAIFAAVVVTVGGVWLRSRPNNATSENHVEARPNSESTSPPKSPEPAWGRIGRPDTGVLPLPPAVEAPWGEIERQYITFAQPPGYINTEDCSRKRLEPWRFSGYTRDHFRQLTETATSDTSLRARLMSMVQCDSLGCTLMPTLELHDALDTHAHAVLFDTLAAWPENTYQVYAWRRHRRHGPWHEMPGLSDRARRLFAQGTWLRGEEYRFADVPWLCARLETEAERLRALEAIKTRYGVTARVKVNATTPLEPLIAWWARGTSVARVRALFQAAAQVPGGGTVPVAELLPSTPRRRMGSFPAREEPLYDCFWTALHFFGESPTAHLPELSGFRAALQHEYESVPFSQLRFGDLIVFSGTDGTIAHVVNHVAGDLVFTKNGGQPHRPWVLSTLEEVRALYPFASELHAWRLRATPAS